MHALTAQSCGEKVEICTGHPKPYVKKVEICTGNQT